MSSGRKSDWREGISTEHERIGRRWYYAKSDQGSGVATASNGSSARTTPTMKRYRHRQRIPVHQGRHQPRDRGGEDSAVNGDGGSKAAAVAFAEVGPGETHGGLDPLQRR